MERERLTLPPAPLAGVTVVEAMSSDAPLALRLAGAMAGRIAADLGARVIILEQPGRNPLRDLPPATSCGDSAVFAFLAAGKQSALDAPNVVSRIAPEADAVIADAGRADLHATTRVLLSMAGDDTTPHTEFTIMALGGLLDIVGDPARPPLRLGGHQLAYAAGLAAYAGLVSSLLRRPATEVARVSLLEVAVWINWKSVASVAATGVVTTRPGRAAEWPILRCADGHVALVYQTKDWPALCRLCGDPRLEQDRFATVQSRRRHTLELADIIEAAFSDLTRQQLQERAMAMRLPLGPIWQFDELRTDPQMLSRLFCSEPLGVPRLPVLWNGERFPVRPAPAEAA